MQVKLLPSHFSGYIWFRLHSSPYTGKCKRGVRIPCTPFNGIVVEWGRHWRLKTSWPYGCTGSSPVDARLLNSNKEEQKHNIVKEIQDEGTVILSDKERPRG